MPLFVFNPKTLDMDELLKELQPLYKELSSKKFPRQNSKAYLWCLMNIKAIVRFLEVYEKYTTLQNK